MLYDIGLSIDYTYEQPAAAGRNLLRLIPRNLPEEQTVHFARLETDPAPTDRRTILDFFLNPAVHLAFGGAHEAIRFQLNARVERSGASAAFDISPALPRLRAEVAEVRDLSPDSPHHFLGPSLRVRPMPDMTAYARDNTAGAGTAYEAVLALNAALHRDLRFDPDATHVETTPSEAFASRHGVCQDFAHIMIACLRGIGIPSGYVSGFLRTVPPEGKPRLEGCDAMHAWVRAWCGLQTGWVEIDPTNALVVAADHIVIARGRDYADVAPVLGVLRTSGGQTTRQAVDVIALDAPP